MTKKEYYLSHREEKIAYARNYEKMHPMRKLLHNIKQRCSYPKDKKYKYYGGKGIKCLLSYNDLIFLWKRDKAHLLKQASIDRKNNHKDYILDNCRFIEMDANRRGDYGRN